VRYHLAIMSSAYLKRILTSRVYDIANETPLDSAPQLTARVKNRVLFKREDTHDVFSFKIRGAYNKMANLSERARARGVLAASAGNHAQGVAMSAQRLGCRAVIVMPVTTPQVKIDAVRSRGAEVVLHGDSFTDAYVKAQEIEKREKLTFVHPFDDPDVIAGQGTVGMEILRQHKGPLDAVFVPIGGGGLMAGVAVYIKQLRPDVRIIGVQTVDSDAMVRSVRAGRRVTLSDVGLFSDGTAVKLAGEETFKLTRKYADDFVLVDTDEVCSAIKDVFQDTRSVLEPAGALAVAGAKQYLAANRWKDKTVIAITSGANMNFDRLRFVSDRADVGQAREAVFAVTIPEERGSFKRFCSLIGERNVTEFNYRMSDTAKAHVFVGLQIAAHGESDKIAATFRKHRYEVLDLTHDELAKTHLRHLSGGHSTLAENEVLYRFEFPERPGALMRFLDCMSPTWNISLFHYRHQGGDYGRILVGMQVPPADKKAFKDFLTNLGYRHWDESQNPAYRLFLR